MTELWDWSDVAALGVMARDAELDPSHILEIITELGWDGDQYRRVHRQAAASIRYGWEERGREEGKAWLQMGAELRKFNWHD